MLIVVNWHISLNLIRSIWTIFVCWCTQTSLANVHSVRSSCPAAGQFVLVMWKRPKCFGCIYFSFCTMHENENENGAYAHTQFEQCNARFDQLHCNLLESVSVRSLVECKQILRPCVCSCEFFLLLKINSHYTSAINITLYGAFYRFQQFQFVKWCMETGISMCKKVQGLLPITCRFNLF